MFGYVKPYKPELTLGEFEVYKGIYCGLCKQIGRIYPRVYRFFLSYDFAFLAILSVALKPECVGFERSNCSFNILKKKTCLRTCDDLSFTSTASILMIYYKLKDDVHDDVFFKSSFKKLLMLLANPSKKKASKFYPELDSIIFNLMNEQFEIEKKYSASLDACCDPTAKAMSYIFALLSNDETQKKVLSKVGYYIGKWIYLIDALDDLEDDIKNGTYNPFKNSYCLDKNSESEIIKTVFNNSQALLNNIVAELALAYELLDLYRYKSILDNIFYLGLKNEQKNILIKRGIKSDE